MTENAPNRRVLVVDDNEAIHMDFKRVLTSATGEETRELDTLAAEFWGDENAEIPAIEANYELQFASQGDAALELVQSELAQGRQFALAFIDVRMPPGWDGIETARHLWEADPALQVVICTAYADYSWSDMQRELGGGHNFVILKKPFDPMEAQQLACALTAKWSAERVAALRMSELEEIVQERTKSLREANQGLRREMAEHAKAEMALKETGKRFQATFEQAAVGMVNVSAEGRLLRWNKKFADLVGYSEEELQATTINEITAPEDAALDQMPLNRLLDKEIESFSVEKRYIRKNGSKIWLNLTVSPLWSGQGRLRYLIYVVQDISDRKKAESDVVAGDQQLKRQRQALVASEKKFATVFLVSPFPMAITTVSNGRFLDVNDAFLEYVGYDHREIAGKTTRDVRLFVDDDQRTAILRQLQIAGSVRDARVNLRAKSGAILRSSMCADKIPIGEGEFLLVVVTGLSSECQVIPACEPAKTAERPESVEAPQCEPAVSPEE